MEYIRVGKIINTHGIRGDLKIAVTTDFLEERFKKGNKLYINDHDKRIEVTVLKSRIHKNNLLVTFSGLEDINMVEKYKGLDLEVIKDDTLLEDNEYYIEDLMGLDVYDGKELIGKVEDIISNTSQNILVVEGKHKVMIPYVDAFIKDVDLDHNKIITELIEGFYED